VSVVLANEELKAWPCSLIYKCPTMLANSTTFCVVMLMIITENQGCVLQNTDLCAKCCDCTIPSFTVVDPSHWPSSQEQRAGWCIWSALHAGAATNYILYLLLAMWS